MPQASCFPKSGYSLLLSSSRDDPDIQRNTLREMVGHDVAGLIWVPTTPSRKLYRLPGGPARPGGIYRALARGATG